MFYQILISSHFDIVDSGWSFCKQYLFNFVFNCIFIFAHYKQAEKVVCCWCRLLVALVTTVPLSHVNWRSCSWIVTRTERCLLNPVSFNLRTNDCFSSSERRIYFNQLLLQVKKGQIYIGETWRRCQWDDFTVIFLFVC